MLFTDVTSNSFKESLILIFSLFFNFDGHKMCKQWIVLNALNIYAFRI